MEQRLASTWRMSVNETKFIENSLLSDLRVDGRRPFDYRRLIIKFGRDDGSSEVQLGNTHVMAFVTSQLVQPYRDRPNEGTLSFYTEFSPMADPSFEAGRPGELAVELGRIIDRGLRESKAVDTESLCVISGKLVWSVRIDVHILDNGGNLVDAANIAALAALSTFRRPECTLGGEDGQELIIHPPEVREPIPLIIHHLPVAVTFGFIGKENIVVIDPTHYEETVMGGRMTVTLNTNGDVCAIQKAGGDGVLPSVESFNTERALRKIKRHNSSAAVDVSEPAQKGGTEFSDTHMCRLNLMSEESRVIQSNGMEVDGKLLQQEETIMRDSDAKSFIGGPSSWDPHSKGVNSDALRASPASQVVEAPTKKLEDPKVDQPSDMELTQPVSDNTLPNEVANTGLQTSEEKTLEDAIKPKHKRKKKKKASSQQ
ncbi:hypothetical protein AG4045_001414 [Apium graveolens]|uniref:Protein ECERIFERUM 7 n=1 Tax=Apium graveolens TaxID=4045 RepID=A0A6L5BC00_APIGR|nr:hypothetical protein AG4045_001414 [Apium graveolens]